MFCGKLLNKVNGILKVARIISCLTQVKQRLPCVGAHEPAWGVNEPWGGTVRSVDSLLQGLYV